MQKSQTPKGALQNILLQIMHAGDAGIAQHTVTGFLQHGVPFSIFFFLADVAGIIQFNNHDHAAVFIQQHKVGHLAVELIAYFIILIGDECAESHLRQHMMLRKSADQAGVHFAFKRRNDASGEIFLLAQEQMGKQQAE